MNIEDRLKVVADRYRNLGFRVVLHPRADDLPAFARDFKVEVVATQEGGGVLTVAKGSPTELESDTEVARYSEITERQPGWKLDVFVLGSDALATQKWEARELGDEEVRRASVEAERLLGEGFASQAVLAAWAVLESAMRRKLGSQRSASSGTSLRTMLNELFSAGDLSNGEFRELENLAQIRDLIVHGFAVPPLPNSAVEFLLRAAKQLLQAPPSA